MRMINNINKGANKSTYAEVRPLSSSVGKFVVSAKFLGVHVQLREVWYSSQVTYCQVSKVFLNQGQ